MSEFNKEVYIDSNELTFKEFILKIRAWYKFLIKQKTNILLFAILGSGVGFTLSFFEKPNYTAILTFAMEDDKSPTAGGGLSGALGLANSFGIDLGGAGGGGAFAATNLTELMKSRLIIQKVLLNEINVSGKGQLLIDYYADFTGLRHLWNKNIELLNINFSKNYKNQRVQVLKDSLIREVYKELINRSNLNIMQKDKKITIINIEVKSENEIFAKNFCEGLAKETSDFYIQTKSKKARLNVDVLQKQVDSVKKELNNSISGAASEIDNVYNLNPAYNIKGAQGKRKQIDVQANTVILTNLVVQLELAKITLRKETPLIQLIDSPILPLEKDKIGKFKLIIIGGVIFSIIFIVYISIIQYFKSLNI